MDSLRRLARRVGDAPSRRTGRWRFGGSVLPIVLAPVLTLAAGCSAAQEDSGLVQITVSMIEDADKLDPTFGQTFGGREVFANMCEKLYDIDANQQVVPQLAAALPELSEGNLVATIPLREGVTFNDGTPLDAAAVKRSLDRHREAEGSARKGELSSVSEVRVVDDHQVQIVLTTPYAPLASILADRSGMIMSPAALDEHGDDFALHPVCVGPFSFVERVSGERIVLEKSTHYYDADQVHIDRLVMRPVTDGTVRVANLRSGDIDIVDRIPTTDFAALQSQESITVSQIPSLGRDSIFLNPRSEAFKDVRVRQAFELAVDKQQIIDTVYNGLHEATCQPFSVRSPFYSKDLACPATDVAKAMSLLREAGVATPVPVTLMVNNDTQNVRRGELIQAQAAKAGFQVKVSPTPAASLLSALTSATFDAYISAWSGRVDPDPNISRFHAKAGSQNYAGWGSPAIDSALATAVQESDQAARIKAYTDVWRQCMDLHGEVVLMNPNLLVGWNTRVQGLTVFGDGLIRLKGVSVGEPGN